MERYTKLTGTKAYRKLLETQPVDLSKGISTERIAKFQIMQKDTLFYYGFERIGDEHLKIFEELVEEQKAHAKFQRALSGDVMNFIEKYPSEKRAVLHTAMRDVFKESYLPHVGEVALKARQDAQRELDKLREFCDKENWIHDIVVIGIGGSYLGTQAVAEALHFYHLKGRRLFFSPNIDPDQMTSLFDKIDLKNTLVCVISKSGTTLETLTNEDIWRNEFKRQGLDPAKHFVAVTGEKSPMDNKMRYLNSFYMWDYVGGRYSVTSMVGAVPLALLIGYNHFLEFLKGAHDMDLWSYQHASIKENIPLMMALIAVYRRALGIDSVAVLPYAEVLFRFVDHLQQLHMESLGKSICQNGGRADYITGCVHFGVPGTNGQHSFYQQLHQGFVKSGIEFIGFAHPEGGADYMSGASSSQQKLLANLFAQMVALATGSKNENPNESFDGNRGSVTLFFPRCKPYVMGELLAIYELKTMFEGFLLGINSYDQPGVQLGKRLATECLNVMKQAPSERPDGLFKMLVENAEEMSHRFHEKAKKNRAA